MSASLSPDDVDEEERAHFQRVIEAFREYHLWMEREMARRERHAAKLAPEDLELLPPGMFSIIHSAARTAVAHNQAFLSAVADSQAGDDDEGGCGEEEGAAHTHDHGAPPAKLPRPEAPPGTMPSSSPAFFSKVVSTLHQFVRDWSSEGEAERAQCYGPILAELQARLPLKPEDRNKVKVLVPGAGLGRLVFEVVRLGYACQGNEFSLFMLFASSFILNHSTEANMFKIHPWVENPSNHLKFADMCRPITVPDVCPADVLAGGDHNFSMCAGDFVEVYGPTPNAWDCVITCFFLDTAPVMFTYLRTIHSILKPGGIWINLGPLLYHWQGDGGEEDERYGESVELCYQEVRHAIRKLGFVMLKEGSQTCPYAVNRLSMMKTVYSCVFFSAQKPL